jgi:hypothetical protein
METRLALGLVLLLVVAGIIIHRRRAVRLEGILNLDVTFRPPEVCLGDSVEIFLMSHPGKTVKASLVEGELVCRRYSSPALLKLEEMKIPGLPVGEPLAMLLFTLGSDLVFTGGVRTSFGGSLPIPADSFPTQAEEGYHIRWTVTMRVHVPGYRPAVAQRELRVICRGGKLVGAGEAKGEAEGTAAAGAVRHPRAADGVVLEVEGDTRDGDRDGKQKNVPSRFSFLEIEEETGNNKE